MKGQRRKTGKPTLSDVAEAGGFSASTASRAISNPESVSASLRERVQRAIEEIGYVPNSAARALASARTDVIGVIVPSVTNSVFSEVLRGVFDALQGSAFQVQFGNTNYSHLKEEQLIRLFIGQRPAAMVITGHDQTRAAEEMLRAAECPVVQIMDLPPDPIDMAVGLSHADAAAAATRHLLDRSYRNIGFLAAQMDTRTRARMDGYVSVMRAAGRFDERLLITTHRPSSVSLGAQLCSEYLSRAAGADAILANNDDIALGALFECQRRRIDVPTDIGICGFNDFEYANVAHPSMTSVQTYRYEMGRRAIGMAIDAASGNRPAELALDVGFELSIRESTNRRLDLAAAGQV
jgi:LacI family gluconate utilization system Gnt-I transcriptional repressor